MGISLEALLSFVTASTSMRSTYFPYALDFKCGPRFSQVKENISHSLSELTYQMDLLLRTYPDTFLGTPAATG